MSQHLFLSGLVQSQQSQYSQESLQSQAGEEAVQVLDHLHHILGKLKPEGRKRVEAVIEIVKEADRIDRREELEKARKLLEENEAREKKRAAKKKADKAKAEAEKKAKEKADEEERRVAEEEEKERVRVAEKKKKDEEALRKKDEERKEAERKRKEDEELERQRVEDEEKAKQDEIKRKADERKAREETEAKKQAELNLQRAKIEQKHAKELKDLQDVGDKIPMGYFYEDDKVEQLIERLIHYDITTFDGYTEFKEDLGVRFDNDKSKFLKIKKEVEEKLEEMDRNEPDQAVAIKNIRRIISAKFTQIYSERRKHPIPVQMSRDGKRKLPTLGDDDDLNFF